MSFFINENDREEAIWATECPARCMEIAFLCLPRSYVICCSLHLRGQCRPNLWSRIRFSLAVISPRWMRAEHRQDMMIDDTTLRSLRNWLKGHRPASGSGRSTKVTSDGFDLFFDVQLGETVTYDLSLQVREMISSSPDFRFWTGTLRPGGKGRLKLAWDNVFCREHVEEWGYVELGTEDVDEMISWIDEQVSKGK